MTQQLSPINPALRASTVKKSPETLTDLPDEMLEILVEIIIDALASRENSNIA